MSEDNDMPRLVRVPIAGYIDVEIDPSIAVETSSGFDSTRFEEAAVEAAGTAIEVYFENATRAKVPLPAGEWSMEPMARISAGNIFCGECNEVEDHGTE